MMSPGRSCDSDLAASARRDADRVLASSPSVCDSVRRIAAYCAKSPFSQVIAVASSAIA